MKKYIFGLILLISVGVSVFFGFQKQGFHEDEYYTYFSSNRTMGLYQPDREWQDRQTILDEFVVKKGEGFNYGLVKLVQSWDVHPPFYYWVFHTLCSMVPGVFTKWTGIITNLIAFVIAYIFLCLLMERLKVPLPVEMMTLLFWGANPMTVSCNLLIRMYAWLTAAIFACAYFHVRLLQNYEELSLNIKDFLIKGLLPIAIVSYIGFLIQYFYIFFFITIGVVTAAWIALSRKRIKDGLIYVGVCAASLALALITYPSALSHMFGGYRGTGAAGSLFDFDNTRLRITFFVGLLNDFVFAGGLVALIFVLALGLIYKVTRRRPKSKDVKEDTRKGPRVEIIALTVGALSYFLLTSKTALLVGSASNRYEMPIYGLLILLLFVDLYYIISQMGNIVLIYACGAIVLALLLKGYINDRNVLFLYSEDAAKISFAAGNAQDVAVVMFNPATPQNVWRLTDELLQYDEVFYADEENLAPIVDEKVISADHVILYIADNDLKKEAMENLDESIPGISGWTFLDSEDMWCTYEGN
jgi:hypothetical protein